MKEEHNYTPIIETEDNLAREFADEIINFIEENGLVLGTWRWADHALDSFVEFFQNWDENNG